MLATTTKGSSRRAAAGRAERYPPLAMTTVHIRLFAALREIAGASTVEAEGATVDEVVAALCERFGEAFADIARLGSVVVDGERAVGPMPLAGGEEIALLPVSGG